MMRLKILKSEVEYEEALNRVEALMDAPPNSSEEDELELLAFLINAYEKELYPIGLPDPIDAIIFRMEQAGLTRKNMREYLGTQSKVSEVLNRKRPLSLRMIRNLHEGLGIPAEVLLQEPEKEIEPKKYDYRQYPFTEMYNRHYFSGISYSLNEAKEYSEELLANFFSIFGGKPQSHTYCRRTERELDINALYAWQVKVLWETQQDELPVFEESVIKQGFVQELVELSYFSIGPQLAKELLNKKGIHFVVLPHLPKTYLDGACFYAPSGRPVIGMTLRHDRLDNFWFTIVHELAHLLLHLPKDSHAFFDNTDPRSMGDPDPQEQEADRFTLDCLVPERAWAKGKAKLLDTDQGEVISAFAEALQISPAIVAGRIRWETSDFTRFSKLIGSKKVRCLFPQFE